MIAAQKRNLNHIRNMSVRKNKALWAWFLTVGSSARVAAAHCETSSQTPDAVTVLWRLSLVAAARASCVTVPRVTVVLETATFLWWWSSAVRDGQTSRSVSVAHFQPRPLGENASRPPGALKVFN